MRYNIDRINKRNKLLSTFAKKMLDDRYLQKNESYQDCFARVASYYADDISHAYRLYKYISKLWFMPSTPILANGGTDRGLPISCFLNEVDDGLKDIVDLWNENVWLASKGGGIGSYWGNVRSIGESVQGRGKTSGIIPFIVVQNALTLAISQGSLRRGSSAVYLPVNHPEIEEFIDLRKPIGGDPNRRALNLHHGIVITDDFMHAVEKNLDWNLVSPKDNKVIQTVKARDLWIKILATRVETGEPYILFIDNVNKHKSENYRINKMEVKTSNLCAEITLATGKDYNNKERTAVCCLSSLNLEKYDEWCDDGNFIFDIMRFLDNVLQDFIDKAPESMKNAVYSAKQERSVGLGVMGFHSYLQQNSIAFDSVEAKKINKKIFKYIKSEADLASKALAEIKDPCIDADEMGLNERFTHKLAIAPTASISIIAGNTSAGIDPETANVFTFRNLSGSSVKRNKYLQELLESKGKNTEDVWTDIINYEGSVQHLEFLSSEEKEVFKTAAEIDQEKLIDMAADRQKYICQSQSLNIFIPPDISKKELHNLHFNAWKKGIKSMYYTRTKSVQRTDKIGINKEMYCEGDVCEVCQ